MINLFPFIIALFLSHLTMSQSTAIPDVNFEQALIDLNIDSDGLNGSILNSDASIVTSLNVENKNISDLSGIEAFESINYLKCSFNNLSLLDLSSNIQLEGILANDNELISIELDGILSLYSIQLQNNQLSSLDLSNHTNLYFLYCFTNNLTSLNISSNYSLVYLSCGENQLTGVLDISKLWQLEFFACSKESINQC
jgi:hypothetical protein